MRSGTGRYAKADCVKNRFAPFRTEQSGFIVAVCYPTSEEKGADMSGADKMKNAADKAVGKAKEAVGEATGNESLEAEGKADQTKANLKQAGENIKDAFKK